MANVRQAPEPRAPIVTQVLLADEVRILERRDYRMRIAIPDQGDREGWIQQEAVQVLRDKGRTLLRADRQRIVITVPKTPALILDRLGNHNTSLYGGTRLPVVSQNADGYRVQFPDRTVAVIPASDAAPVRPFSPLFDDVAPADIVKTARKFLGVRYLSGGLTAQGMDSRGLIHVVYRIHGIDLDTEYDALKACAVKVPKKEILPGDILVFSGEGMGLLLTNGQFLRGDRKAGIQLGAIHDRRYANSLLYGLRVIGTDPGKKRPAEMTADEIMIAQTRVMGEPLGKRITYWAERFIGTPYDTDPLGLYVRTNSIVADAKADCMYLTFRSVELARSTTPGEAVEQALDLRFRTKGVVADGLVTNYGERFEYGEDMVYSGKWGRNITEELGRTTAVAGSRGRDTITMLPKESLAAKTVQQQLQDGDIIYWVKDPKKRSAAMEIVAHLSFVRLKDGKVYLVHAGGTKDSDTRPGKGQVKEVLLANYLHETKFVGALVTRLEQ